MDRSQANYMHDLDAECAMTGGVTIIEQGLLLCWASWESEPLQDKVPATKAGLLGPACQTQSLA